MAKFDCSKLPIPKIDECSSIQFSANKKGMYYCPTNRCFYNEQYENIGTGIFSFFSDYVEVSLHEKPYFDEFSEILRNYNNDTK